MPSLRMQWPAQARCRSQGGIARTTFDVLLTHPVAARYIASTTFLRHLRGPMATIIEDIEAAALRLPRADRARLAELLWASLGDDPEVMKKWEVEIERRVREIREGKGRSIPAEQVFREIEEMLR